jgi:hypothetical protein
MPVFPIKVGKTEWRVKSRMVLPKTERLGQTKKIISFSGQFPKILMRQGGTFFYPKNRKLLRF